ncbi:ATP-binding protein [Pseudogemmobacter humi]|uniref:Histidine kinase/HSP90-like ATPase domain-containing protein n=1 Tax=Pseudogemmobacter humi TaxID=2483812 RepID=A0A3P5X4B5_9RHOB|nr:ATP-binding protein [Pseudogemmobacter humi]VDC26110.1 hypothetical protein XINFAN_01598 [Pseudogemmobacter humi]
MRAERMAVNGMASQAAVEWPFALIEMPGDLESVRAGLARAMRSAPLARLGPEDRGRAEILLAEVLNNIAEHACCGSGAGIRLLLRLEPARLCLVVEDDGVAMPSGALPAGELPDAASLPEGGFGWFLIRSLAREISYLRDGKTNRLGIVMDCEQ